MYTGTSDLLDCLQDKRFVDRRKAGPLIEAIEELDDQVRSGEEISSLDLRALRQFANSNNQQISKIASVAMPRFGSPMPLADLEELLADDSPIVRQVAATTAGALEQPESAPALISQLDNTEEEPEVRRAAVLALRSLQHPEIPAALARALEDSNKDIRKLAAKAFADLAPAIGVESAGETLRGLLKDEMPDVRAYAAEALGKMADPGAANALADALADPDASVRNSSALALAILNDDRAVSALVAILAENGPYRCQAATALGNFSGPTVNDALLGVLNDEDHDVRLAAKESLRKIGDPDALKILQGRAGIGRDSDVPGATAAAVDDLEEGFGAPLVQQPAQAEQKTEALQQPVAEKLDVFEAMNRAATDLGCDIEKTETGLRLRVPVPGGFKQTVEVSVSEEDSSRVLRVVSVCGPADPGNYRQALLLNRHLVFGAISLRKGRPGADVFELSEAIFADHATVEILSRAISYIASAANQMGRQLSAE